MSEDFKGAFRKDNPLGGSIIPVRVITLEEAAKFLSGGTPSKSEPEYWTGNIPWVSAKDMKTLLISDTEDHITSEGAAVGSKIAPVGSILILVRGMTLLFDVPICYANRELTFNQDVKALVPRDGVDPRYLMYALLAAKPQLLDHVDQAGHGTGRLATDLLKSLEIRLPDIREQRRIAHILGTLDDRIELNRRMNATLEAVARALFQSWFVDFDPVRAKVEGRQPAGMDEATAALFPDEFEESELGEVPRGWEVKKIGELGSLDKGLSYKGKFLSDQGTPMINLGCLVGNGIFDNDSIKYYLGDYKEKHTVKPGDLLIANTDLTQTRLVLGSPAIVPPCDNNSESLFTHHLFAFRFFKETEWWKLFVYYLLLQNEFRERAEGYATGTTVLAIPRDTILDCLFVSPSRTIIEHFYEIAVPLMEIRWKNEQESCNLAALRDILLPRLLSGEISVTTNATPVDEA